MANGNPKDNRTFSTLFAGTGLGLLVGLIAGLSVSPVVSIILGSLAALLAAFLGLTPASEIADESEAQQHQHTQQQRLKSLRAGSFGIVCVIGVLSGLYLRVNDVFNAPLPEQIKRWTDADYPPEQAREFVAFQRLGIKPKGREVISDAAQKSRVGGLFHSQSEGGVCPDIKPDRYKGDPTEVLKALKRQDMAALNQLAEAIKSLDLSDEALAALVTASAEALCKIEQRATAD